MGFQRITKILSRKLHKILIDPKITINKTKEFLSNWKFLNSNILNHLIIAEINGGSKKDD